MSNNQLPDSIQERIKADALTRYPPRMASPRVMVEVDMNEGRRLGYIAGATAVHERAQPILGALDQFIAFHESGLLPARHVYENAIKVREQWKGKEVENDK